VPSGLWLRPGDMCGGGTSRQGEKCRNPARQAGVTRTCVTRKNDTFELVSSLKVTRKNDFRTIFPE